MLVEYAGDLIPSVATTMGGDKFAPYLAGMLQLLFAKTVSLLNQAFPSWKDFLYYDVILFASQ